MPADVELHGVTKFYGEVKAVNAVSLTVQPGEFLTLLGPSGCGKTTTLRMIGGFETPDAGRVIIQGNDVTRVPPASRNTSMVFQDYALFPHLTVAENVAFGLQMRRTPPHESKARTAEALRLVNLADLGGRKPHQLSGGQKQRVALARSLVLQPAVLLLDEPLGALDAQIRKLMQMELKNIQKQLGQTFIYVTHDQEEALTMSDQLAILRGGRIEQSGPPDEVYENPASPFVASFLGECNLLPGIYQPGPAGQGFLQDPDLGSLPGCSDRGNLMSGSAAVLCLRPENIRLQPESSTAKGEPAAFSLPGIISRRVYRGMLTRYTVTVHSQIEFTVEILGKGSLPPGEKVTLGWERRHAVILPQPAESTQGREVDI